MSKAAGHPLAGTTMTGADMIVQVLADEGVDTIFGYSGGAILPTYDAVFRYNREHNGNGEAIRLVVPANEQGAGFMAAGYARATGKVGVFLVTSGPGATNCVTPVRDCMADSIPVVLICGQVARAAIGTDAFQEAPVFNIMSPCAKHTFLVSDETQIEATIRTAFKIARSGRPGPVVIDVPKDVQNALGTFQGEGCLAFRGFEERVNAVMERTPSKDECAEFLDLINRSKRPLIYAGGGVINADAAAELRAFAEHFQIPIVTTLMGIGAADTTSPLSLHMLGMHGTAYANYAVDDCDLLIAVGARFDDRVAGKASTFAAGATIAHIDIDMAEIGKVKGADWSYAGNVREALKAFVKAAKGHQPQTGDWVAYVNGLKKKYPMNYNRESDLIQPQEVLERLNAITKGEAIVCTGVGQHQMWAAQFFDFHRPRSFITSGSMGTMGFGLPAAIGAQLAMPGRVVIDVDGDGSLRMNLGELETATTYGAAIKVLLLNNLGDGMVRQWQTLYFDERFSGTDKSLHRKDFVRAVEADGFEFARRIAKKDELQEALEAFVAFEGPAFLEVMIDPNAHVYPMVGPGMSYKEMLTGPYINSRASQPQKAELDTSDSF